MRLLQQIRKIIKNLAGNRLITVVLSGMVLCTAMPQQVFAQASEGITLYVTVAQSVYLHNGITADVLNQPVQAVDGTGKITLSFRIYEALSNPADVVPGSFAFRVNGAGWIAIADADITGTKTGLSTAPNLTGPIHTLVWDNSKEYIDDAYSSNVEIRFKVSSPLANSRYGVSPLPFAIDNLDPAGMANFSLFSRRSKMECDWTAVTAENSWNGNAHYEIWYGTNLTDVENRNGTALKWDQTNDSDLAVMATTHTTINGLTPSTPYYFKIWAIDNFGNEANLAVQSAVTLGNGTVVMSAGDKNPPNGSISYSGHNSSMLQLKLSVGPAEDVRMTSITFNAGNIGTGDDLNHILAGGVKLYYDTNGNGKVDLAGDVPLGSSSYNADNGTVTFNGLTQDFSSIGTAHPYPNQNYNLLVAYDLAGVDASVGKTFQAIFQQAVDVSFTGAESNASIVPTGTFPIPGGVMTVVKTGRVIAELKTTTTPAEDILNNVVKKRMLQIQFTETTGYENVRFPSIKFTAIGTGNEAAALTRIGFWSDENNNGIIDSNIDTFCGYGTYNAGDRTITKTFTWYRVIPAGGTKSVLVTYDFNGTALAGQTFGVSVQNNTDVELHGDRSQTQFCPEITNFPIESNLKTIVSGDLQVTYGPSTPVDGYIKSNALNEAMIQIRLSEIGGKEDVWVKSVIFHAIGSGDESTAIKAVKFYYDENNNGVVDSGDEYLGSKTFSADNGTVSIELGIYKTVPANGYRNLLVLYDFNGNANNGDQFQLNLNAAVDISAAGRTSKLNITAHGNPPDEDFPYNGAVKTIGSQLSGKLYISEGANNPANSNIRTNSLSVSMLQFNLAVDSVEDVTINSVKIHHNGSGDEHAVSEVSIYRDVDNNGKLTFGDVFLGSSTVWNSPNCVITLDTPEHIQKSTNVNYLVVYNFNGTANNGDTFICTFDNNHDISSQGESSLISIAASGSYSITGPVRTVSDRGTLVLNTGKNNPGPGNVVVNQSDVVMLQMKVDADFVEDVNISGIIFTHTGKGTPATDLSNVRLYVDTNGNGLLDVAGDTLIAQGNTWVGNTLTLNIVPNHTVSADSSEHWIVVYDFNGNASEAETFQLSLIDLNNVTATGAWSSLPVVKNGVIPINGPIKRIVPTRGHIYASTPIEQNPARNFINNAKNVTMMVLKLEEYGLFEDVRINELTIHGTGTGNEKEDITSVVVYEDENANGVVDTGDVYVGTKCYSEDNGSLKFPFTWYRRVGKGETKNLLVIYNFNGKALADETFQVVVDHPLDSVDPLTDLIMQGLTTGIYIPLEEAVPGDFPLKGGLATIWKGGVSITTNEAPEGHNPGPQSVCTTATKVLGLEIKVEELTNREPARIYTMTLHATGIMDEWKDISSVEIWGDNDNNGVISSSDSYFGKVTFDANEGKAIIPMSVYSAIPAGQSRTFLFFVNFNGKALPTQKTRLYFDNSTDFVIKGISSSEQIDIANPEDFPLQGGEITMATDPSGVVYNSLTGDPIAGATVTIQKDLGGGVWVNAVGGGVDIVEAVPTQVTPAGGNYSFNITAAVGTNFRLQITPPAGFAFPSTVIPIGSRPRNSDIAGSHGEAFTHDGAAHTIDLPLDPSDTSVLKVTKTANKTEAVVGDIITYTVMVENKYGADIDNFDIRLQDKLPVGFKYLKGTTLLDGAAVSDPDGRSTANFNIGHLTTGQTKTISYQAAVGAGVIPGNYYQNIAKAISPSGLALSNTSGARVKIVYDPIFDLSVIIGKVFNDKNGNEMQDAGEMGIPDVKIATEDGLFVITDKDGKYHFDGIKPQSKLFKIDESSLPQGSQVISDNPRLVRLTPGILSKVNFGVKLSEDLIKQVREDGAPYLEVKVAVEPAKVSPQLTAVYWPNQPQFDSSGAKLEEPILFKINTNYPDFIKNWTLEIYRADNTLTPARVFSGTREDLFKAIEWDGMDSNGAVFEPDVYHTYKLIVQNAKGDKDITTEKKILIKTKHGLSNVNINDRDKITAEMFENSLNSQMIMLTKNTATIKVEGLTDKNMRVFVEDQDLGVTSDGKFSKDLIVPTSKVLLTVETIDDLTNKKTVFTKKLKLNDDYFFLVALADSEFGQMKANGNVSGVRDNDKYRNGFYVDGRLAYYLKAKIKGKYLITSSYDNARQNDAMKRVVNPERYYPVYGDSSSITDDTNSKGKFYILAEWDKSSFTWGNYTAATEGTELATYNRSLYGGKFQYKSVANTQYGDPNTILMIYGAESSNLPAHNELLSTGGSLHYLKHKDVIEGSETVRLEVRDRDTGLVKNTYACSSNIDYEIDYSQGRIMFYKPVSMIAAAEKLISVGPSLGDPIYVIVDYDYKPSEYISESNYGARVSQQLNDHVRVGFTHLRDEKDSGYKLSGFDTTVKLLKATELKAEYAKSESTSFANYYSPDGGLTFTELPSNESLKGRAYKFSLKSDIGEIFNKKFTNKILWQGYCQNIGAGFSSQGTAAGQGARTANAALVFNISAKDMVTLIYDQKQIKSKDNLQVADLALTTGSSDGSTTKTEDFTLQYKHTSGKLTVTGETKYHKENGNTTASSTAGLAGKMEYEFTKKLTGYVQQQTNVTGKADSKWIVGATAKVTEKIKATLEQLFGRNGSATNLGADVNVNPKTKVFGTYGIGSGDGRKTGLGADTEIDSKTKVFGAYNVTTEGGNETATTTVGTERKVNDTTKITTATEYTTGTDSISNSHIIGVSTKVNKWDMSLKLDRGESTSAGVTTLRTAGSLTAGYADPEKWKYCGKIELRVDQGAADKYQFIFQNNIEQKLNRDWTGLLKLEYDRTYNTTIGKIEAEYKEFMIGGAYRPIDFDRWNFLTKISYIENKSPSSQSDTASISAERKIVLSMESAYDLNQYWQWVEKGAIKRTDERVSNRPYAHNMVYLLIHRFNYRFNSKWEFGVEYRTLSDIEAQDSKRGFLIELSRYLNKNFIVGIGYNFTDYNDDLAHENNYSVKGFFFRATGKY